MRMFSLSLMLIGWFVMAQAPVIPSGQVRYALSSTKAGDDVGSPIYAQNDPEAWSIIGQSVTGFPLITDPFFVIDNSGQLIALQDLSGVFEAVREVVLELQAENATGSSVMETVSVQVVEHVPTPIIVADQTRTVGRLARPGDLIGQPVNGTSVESWWITNPLDPLTHGAFTINAVSGQLSLVLPPQNYWPDGSISQVNLEVSASNGFGVTTESVEIYIVPDDAHIPLVFPDQERTVSIYSEAGTAVGSVLNAAGTVTFWGIVGGTGQPYFSVNQTGQISVLTSLLEVVPTSLTLEVVAGNGNGVSDSATVTVFLSNDTQFLPTICVDQVVMVSRLAEAGDLFGDLLCGVNVDSWSIAYASPAGNDAAFALSSTGQFSVAQNLSDLFIDGVIHQETVNVVAYNQYGSNSGIVYVYVLPGDSSAPVVFPSQTRMISSTGVVGTIAGDALLASGNPSYWSVVGGTGQGFFGINNAGQVFSLQPLESLLVSSPVTLDVVAGNAFGVSAIYTLSITIVDNGSLLPALCGQGTPTRTISVMAEVGSEMGDALCGQNVTCWNINHVDPPTNEAAFAIDTDGQLSVARPLSEVFPTNAVTVASVDVELCNDFGTATERVYIYVVPEGTTVPMVLPSQDRYVSAASQSGAGVGSPLQASGDPTYWGITGGTAQTYFDINNAGQLTVLGDLNSLLPSSPVTLEVVAGNESGTSVPVSIDIYITAGGSILPGICDSQTLFVSRLAQPGESIGDPLCGQNADYWFIEYASPASNDAAFSLSSDGQLTVFRPLSPFFADGSIHTVTLNVVANNEFGQTVGVIYLYVVPDDSVVPLILPQQDRSVCVESINGSGVGDPLVATASPTYWTIVGGTGVGYFSINNAGQVTVACDDLTDLQPSSPVTLDLIAGNGYGPSDPVTIEVAITDVAPGSVGGGVLPALCGQQTRFISRIALPGEEIGDPLCGQNVDCWYIEYANPAANDAAFGISNSGQLQVLRPLGDLFSPGVITVVPVNVVLCNENGETTDMVYVYVIPEDAYLPAIVAGQLRYVWSNAFSGSTIGGAIATVVPDGTTISGWEIVSGNDDGLFSINDSGSLLLFRTISGLTYTNGQVDITLTLRCHSNFGPSEPQTITVRVFEYTSSGGGTTAEAPVIQPNQTRYTTSGAIVGSTIGDPIYATGSPATWWIDSGNVDGAFYIDSLGRLYVLRPLEDVFGSFPAEVHLFLACANQVGASAPTEVVIYIYEGIGGGGTGTNPDITASFTDINLLTCIRTHLGLAPGEPIAPGDAQSLEHLDCFGLGIQSIDGLEHFFNLVFLGLANNVLTNVNKLSGLKELDTLILSGNLISLESGSFHASPIANLTNLTYLDLSYNQIQSVEDLGNLLLLDFLALDHNRIDDIDTLVANYRIQSAAGTAASDYVKLGDNCLGDAGDQADLFELRDLIGDDNRVESQNNPSALCGMEVLTFSNWPDKTILDYRYLIIFRPVYLP